jgi:hypothetical protein
MGVAIMKRDGSIVPHPDPEAQNGILTAFARSKDSLFALRWRERLQVSDVVEISDSTVRVVWTATHYWTDIAVGESSLALVRIGQDEIESGEATDHCRARRGHVRRNVPALRLAPPPSQLITPTTKDRK